MPQLVTSGHVQLVIRFRRKQRCSQLTKTPILSIWTRIMSKSSWEFKWNGHTSAWCWHASVHPSVWPCQGISSFERLAPWKNSLKTKAHTLLPHLDDAKRLIEQLLLLISHLDLLLVFLLWKIWKYHPNHFQSSLASFFFRGSQNCGLLSKRWFWTSSLLWLPSQKGRLLVCLQLQNHTYKAVKIMWTLWLLI